MSQPTQRMQQRCPRESTAGKSFVTSQTWQICDVIGTPLAQAGRQAGGSIF